MAYVVYVRESERQVQINNAIVCLIPFSLTEDLPGDDVPDRQV